MNLAPGLAHFIDSCNEAMPPDFYHRPLPEQRALYENLADVFPYEMPPGVAVCDLERQGAHGMLRIRTFAPQDRMRDGLIFYIRGGGFVVGSLETHNSVAGELASRSRLPVVAIDFPMAPEHPFPAALEVCAEALTDICDGSWDIELGFDPADVVLAGDSSGANMAVVVAMMCRDAGVACPAGLALISPVLDFTRWCSGGEDAPLLTGGEMEYYTACYCPDPEQVRHPYVSPSVSGTFDRLPPTYVMGAELDSLRVDGDELVSQIRAMGGNATHVVERGLVHSAVRARGYSPAVADAWDRFCRTTGVLAQKVRDDV